MNMQPTPILVQLMQHKLYLLFWCSVMLLCLVVGGGIWYELHRIFLLLKK